MLVWSGAGYVVPVVTFAVLVATEASVEAVFGDGRYYQHHGWPKMLGAAIAGAIVLAIGRALKRRQAKAYVEKDTGQEVVVAPDHTFFWIDVERWGYLLFALACVLLFVETE